MTSKTEIPEPFPTPVTEEPETKGVEHIVYVGSVGGATVLSSESLQFKNLDMIYDELNPENVRKTIIHFRPHLGNIRNLNVKVIDKRE